MAALFSPAERASRDRCSGLITAAIRGRRRRLAFSAALRARRGRHAQSTARPRPAGGRHAGPTTRVAVWGAGPSRTFPRMRSENYVFEGK